MSDVSQGPGWWIASDDKWYPPHLHPSVRVPESSESAGVEAISSPVTDTSTSDTSAVDTAATDTSRADPLSATGPVAETPSRYLSTPAPSFPVSSTPASGEPDASQTDPGQPYSAGFPAETPAPKKRSRGPLAAALSVVVVILVIVGAVVVFGGSESASAKVINAVDNTINNGTAHLTMTLSGKADGTDVTGTGTGSIDFTNNALQLQMSVGADGQQVPINAIYLNGVVYESIPGLSTVVPGKSWLSIDLSALQKAESQDPTTQGLGSNPTVMLQMLAQEGNTVVPLGPSTINGVAVNGYSVTVNPSTMANELKKANLPAWMQQAAASVHVHDVELKAYIDSSGLLRSFSTDLTESTSTTGTINFDESLDFSDYGTPVNVNAPAPGQVESYNQLLQIAGNQGTPTS